MFGVLKLKRRLILLYCVCRNASRIEGVQLTQAMAEEVNKGNREKFNFDYIFDGTCTQADVYHATAAHMIKDVFKGINCTIFAYGQTGTGLLQTLMFF